MTTLLQLNNSIFGDTGQSSQLADRFVAQWQSLRPEARVIRRDLAAVPVPHLTQAEFTAAATPQADRSPEQAAAARLADELIQELQSADVLVIGLPIYNFTLPSTLKAWFDRVARAGTTFHYTGRGPAGLLEAKKAYIFTTSGGQYAGTPADFQAPYIRHFIGFLGITDVEFIYAEGLAMGEDTGRKARATAADRIEALVTRESSATVSV